MEIDMIVTVVRNCSDLCERVVARHDTEARNRYPFAKLFHRVTRNGAPREKSVFFCASR